MYKDSPPRPNLVPIDSAQSDFATDHLDIGSFWSDVDTGQSGSIDGARTPVIDAPRHPLRDSLSSLSLGDRLMESLKSSDSLHSTTSLEYRMHDAPEAKQGNEILTQQQTRVRSWSADGDIFSSFKRDLQAENIFLRNQIDRAQNLLHAAGVTGQKYKEENKELRRKLATEVRTDEQFTNRLENQIEALTHVNDTLKVRDEGSRSRIKELEHEVSTQKHNYEIGQSDWEDRERHLNREIESLTTQISELQTANDHLKNEFHLKVERLQNEVDTFTSRNSMLTSDNAQLVDENQRLAGELQFSQHQNKMMMREMAETSNVLRRASTPKLNVSVSEHNVKGRPPRSGPPRMRSSPRLSAINSAEENLNDEEYTRPRFTFDSTNLPKPVAEPSDSKRRQSTSQLAGHTMELIQTLENEITEKKATIEALNTEIVKYDEKFHEVVDRVDALIVANAKVDRLKLREISELIRRHCNMESFIAPPVGTTPPPSSRQESTISSLSGASGGLASPADIAGDEFDDDEYESKIKEERTARKSSSTPALWMNEQMFLDVVRFGSYQSVVVNFFDLYAKPENWSFFTDEYGVNQFELWMNLNQSIRSRRKGNKLEVDKEYGEKIEVRMSFLYPLIVMLGQTIGIERRCYAYAYLLMLWSRETQINWMASAFAEMRKTLQFHADPKLSSFVYGVLHFVFVTYKHVRPYVGSQTNLGGR